MEKTYNCEWSTTLQLCEETNLCRDTVMKLAKEANAIIKIGRSVRIIRKKFFAYSEKKYCVCLEIGEDKKTYEEVREEENGS